MGERFTISAPEETVEKWREEAGDKQGELSKYGIQVMEAGRKELGLVDTYETPDEPKDEAQTDQPEVPDLKYRVVQELDKDESKTPDEIVQGITEGLEEDVEDIINELMSENQIQFQDGGFVKG